VAVDHRQRKTGVRAAETYSVGFIEAALVGARRADRDARQPLQRVGDVLVGHLADVFGGDDLHDAGSGALLLDRLL